MFPSFSTVPYTKTKDNLIPILMVIGASLVIALAAQVRIFLPFTPIPITLQTIAVMLAGLSLGSKKGALAVLLYLAEAQAGLPVLSGWRADPAFLFTPVGGYLVGFVLEAWIIGWITEQVKKVTLVSGLFALSAGTIAMLSIGTLWLVPFVGWNQAFPLGMYPFLLIESIKIIIVASCVLINEKLKV